MMEAIMPLIIMVTIKQSAKFSLKTPYYYSVGPIYCYLLTKVSGALTLELILLVSSIFIFYFFKVIRFGLTVTLSLSLSLSLICIFLLCIVITNQHAVECTYQQEMRSWVYLSSRMALNRASLHVQCDLATK